MKKMFKLLFLIFSTVLSAQNMTSTKTVCINQSEYPSKNTTQLKKQLIELAKQESLEELYGTLIVASVNVADGMFVSDDIKSRAVGAVRVKGNPKFYNGSNFGEMCARVTSYVTKEDLKRYSPKEVKLKHFCFNDTSVSLKNIKMLARLAAYKEMLMRYKPSMNNISKEEAQNFLHGFVESNTKFDLDTYSYCFDAVGTVLPYELEMNFSTLLETNIIASNSDLKVELRTNKGKRNPVFKDGEDIELFVRLNKVGYYYIVGYTQTNDKKFSYLLELQGGEGDDKFVKYMGNDEINKWISLGEFVAKSPFGTDSLQVIASTSKIESLPDYIYDADTDFYIISKNIYKALMKVRAIGRKDTQKQIISEAVVSFRTHK